MIAVMFGVPPTAEGFDSYLDHAARLRPLLNQMDRFISIERFRSISDEGKVLHDVLLAQRWPKRCESGARDYTVTEAGSRVAPG